MDGVNGFCDGVMTGYPIDSFIPGLPQNEIGMIMAVTGLLNILLSLGTIVWIKRKEWEARQEGSGDDAAKSVIFPVFVIVVWGNVIANVYAGFIVALVPLRPAGDNSFVFSTLYSSQTALHHIVTEGIAFLLLQKGCGYHAGREAGKYAAIWGVVTFCIMFFIYHENSNVAEAVNLVYDGCLAVSYGLLWLAPQEKLYRRPALISYSKFWLMYRLCAMFINLLLISPDTVGLGNCSYIVVQIIFYSVFQPLVCYWTLLQDSRWWQGLDIGDQSGSARAPSYENIRSPLIGSDFSLTTAQSLAATMDQIRVHGHVKMLNFACIKIDFNKPLGSGSFSKVCRGSYRGKECAIKLIYTVDLTTDVIRRVAAEASILSSIRHPNIVHIYGVSVLPPSVCLILEICSFGSLSDVIRGYGFDWSSYSRAPLSLAYADVLHLALGCARGLAAVHAYDRYLCHRDVKSFNFLVDHQFNVKIADLELGVRDKDDKSRRRAPRRTGQQAPLNRQDRAASGWRSWLSNMSASNHATIAAKRAQHSESAVRDHHDDGSLVSDNSYHRSDPSKGDRSHMDQDDDISVDTSRSGQSVGSYNSHISRQHLDVKDNNLVDELLANWMAPEVISQRKFQQASDVYALGTVLWEILAKKLPFEQCETQRDVRALIISGYQHPIPVEAQDSPLAYIIQQCWEMDPAHRPKASDVVRFLEKILHEDVFRSRIPEGFIAHAPDFTTMMHYYEACYRKSTVSDVHSQLRLQIRSIDRSGGLFSRMWGVLSAPFGGQQKVRHRSHQSSISKSVSVSQMNASEVNHHNSLVKLNPTSNHFEEDDDVDFAFNLPTYSVRGSEMNSTATALSVAADLRQAMKGRRQQYRSTGKKSSVAAYPKKKISSKANMTKSSSSERVESTDAVAADKVEDPEAQQSGPPVFDSPQKRRDEVEDAEEDASEAYSHEQSKFSSQYTDDAIPEGNEEDSDEENRIQSKEGYMSSLARMAMPMPPAAIEAVRMVKNESFWYELEASKEAWAVITPKAPYIIVHGTKNWIQRFSMVTTTPLSGFSGPDAPMLSLLALLAPEIEAMPQQTHATSNYVQLASTQHPQDISSGAAVDATGSYDRNNGFRKMRSASAKEVLKALQRQEEYHGVLSLHMPNIQATNRGGFGGSGASVVSGSSTTGGSRFKSSGESSLATLSRTYSSPLGNAMVSVDATGRLTGVNTMFSVHIYPVHYNRSMAMSNSDSIDSNAAYNVSSNVAMFQQQLQQQTQQTVAPGSVNISSVPVLSEEPLILPPLHETTAPDPPHLLVPGPSSYPSSGQLSPAVPSSPIPIGTGAAVGFSSEQPESFRPSAQFASPASYTHRSTSGRITSYIDDYRSRRNSSNVFHSPSIISPSAAAATVAAEESGRPVSNLTASLSAQTASALPRPGVPISINSSGNMGMSSNNNTSNSSNYSSSNTGKPTFFSRQSTVRAANAKNQDSDRQLVYFAILFHELREQSEQFLHPSASRQQSAHHSATNAFTGLFRSRPGAGHPPPQSSQSNSSNPMHNSDRGSGPGTHDDDDDESYTDADAAHTMSRTYSRNTTSANPNNNANRTANYGHMLFGPDDIIREVSKESSRAVSLAEEEEEYVRRYRETSVNSNRHESSSEPTLHATVNPALEMHEEQDLEGAL